MLFHILVSFSLCANPLPVIPESQIRMYFYPNENIPFDSCRGNNMSYNTITFQCETINDEQSYNPSRLYNISETGINLMVENQCPSNLKRVFNTCIPSFELNQQYSSICSNLYTGDLLQRCIDILSLFEISNSLERPHPQALQFFANQYVIQDYPPLINQPYSTVFNNPAINNLGYIYWPLTFPFFTYLSLQATSSTVFDEIYIESRFKFAQIIQFYVARYKWDGEFIGFSPVTTQFDKCGHKNNIKQIWRKFLTNLKIECFFDLTRDANEESNEFYELFIEDGKTEKGVIIRPIPIFFNGKIGRRFYTFSNITNAGVKFIDSTTVNFTIIDHDSRSSTIQTPYFSFRTRQVSLGSLAQLNSQVRFDSNTDQHPKYTFEVLYSKNMNKFNQDFIYVAVFVGIFAILVTFYSGLSAFFVDGRTCELSSMGSILITLFSNGARFIFILTLAYSIYYFIFFKFQKAFYQALPPENNRSFKVMRYFLIITPIFEGVMAIGRIALHLRNYFILIDWEEASGNGGVSAWRKINASNELNRISVIRSYSIPFTIITILFILNGFNVDLLSTPIPSLDLLDIGYSAWYLRLGLTGLLWLGVMGIQYLYFHFLYWRFLGNPFFNLLDLCSMSNLSLLIVTSSHHGFYLHGKTVHSNADVDMKKLAQFLIDEECNLVDERGMDNETPHQVFELFFSNSFAGKISENRSKLENRQGFKFFKVRANELIGIIDEYEFFCNYLKNFIQKKGSEDQWNYADPDLFQHVFKAPGQLDAQTLFFQVKDIIYKRSLLSGIEWSLMFTYMMIFCAIAAFNNVGIAGLVIIGIDLIVINLYKLFFRTRLARSSLLDTRFLLNELTSS